MAGETYKERSDRLHSEQLRRHGRQQTGNTRVSPFTARSNRVTFDLGQVMTLDRFSGCVVPAAVSFVYFRFVFQDLPVQGVSGRCLVVT